MNAIAVRLQRCTVRIRGFLRGVLTRAMPSVALAAVAGCSATAGATAPHERPPPRIVGTVPSTGPQQTSSSPSAATATSPFDSELNVELARRSGHVSAAVFDLTTGHTYALGADRPVYTASIVKVAVLASLLQEAEQTRSALTPATRQLVDRMIEQSDNAATTTLWQRQGGAAGLQRLFAVAGMTETTPAPTILEPWDGVRTTARDQLLLLRSLFASSRVLDDADASYVLDEMAHVEPSQRWGIGAGTSATSQVSLKNGWLPVPGQGWTVNSIGEVRTGAHAYLIAVLGSDAPSMDYGIGSIELVARQATALLSNEPQSRLPSGPAQHPPAQTSAPSTTRAAARR